MCAVAGRWPQENATSRYSKCHKAVETVESLTKIMKAISYKDDLLVELQDPEYASMYLEQTLETGDMQAFLIAMRDVVEARGGVAKIAQSAQMQRQGLYKVLSSRGNPRLATLQGILKSMGLRMAITQALPASAS